MPNKDFLELADLYSKIAETYDKPTSAEMDNLSAIEDRYNKAMAKFKSIKQKRLPKVTAFASKNELPALEIKAFEEFLDM